MLAVIEEALEVRPFSVALRVHLGELLLRSGRPEDALKELRTALLRAPAHLEAISLAAQAARMCGNEPRALAYERLAQGLLPLEGDEIRVAVPSLPSLEVELRRALRHVNGANGDLD